MVNDLQHIYGLVIWLTGLPCSGKTTLSLELEKYFKRKKLPVKRLDGDVFRKKRTRHLGFTKKDRIENIRLAALEAKRLAEGGTNVVTAFISPYEEARNLARKICPNFIEVYMKCDLGECMRRDEKGMYKMALEGKIRNFTGIQDPYEAPEKPDLVLDTEKETPKQVKKKIIEFISGRMGRIETGAIKEIARMAGKETLKYYCSKNVVRQKKNKTPVTEADIASEKIIKRGLKKFGFPILSEEAKDDKRRLVSDYVWIADPLDGTSDFINKEDEFSIMIALARNERPVLGVIYEPAADRLYFAQKGKGAFLEKDGRAKRIKVSSKSNPQGARMLMSRHHLLEEEIGVAKKLRMKMKQMGSAGLKIARIAEGKAEIYINSSDKSSEWDTCAGDIILTEAGGKITNLNGRSIKYNRKNPRLLNGYIVSNKRLHEKIISTLKNLA